MSQEYEVLAASRNAIHYAGSYLADSPEQAVELAREYFIKRAGGWTLPDAASVRFSIFALHESVAQPVGTP
jgi:1,2-phenylacetyl-CoA epoxidase PaaB subunit